MKKIIVSALALSALVLTGCAQNTTTDTSKNLDSFAKCLTEKEVMIYTSPTCSHCQNQKALFWDSWQYINDIDCLANPNQCWNIKSVPNRVINGENILGEQSLESLSQKSGCEI